MGEFDDLDPSELAKSVENQRAGLQQEAAESGRKEREEANQRAAERATSLAEAEDRTAELFAFLRKAFHGQKMSIGQDLVVEQTGSRPDGLGLSRLDEKPAWVVIRAAGVSTGARHEPKPSFFSPEYILAARCGINTKYELLIYPIKRQAQTDSFGTNDRDEFLKWIQDEIARR